jgi:hypothetical protein
VLICRKSPISGTTNLKEINVTKEQIDNWKSGTLIQLAMPNISADDREFIKTGILPDEWDRLFA